MAIVLQVPCDEGTGTTAADDSGNGLDLTPGTMPDWTLTARGYALDLNGTTHNLQNSSWGTYNPTSAITVACWVNGPAQDNQIVLSHYDSGSNQRSWTIGTANSAWSPGDTADLAVIISQNGALVTNYKIYEATTTDAFDDSWHHIAFTWSSASGLKLYVDGVPQTTSKISDLAVTSLHDSSANLMLGALFSSGSPANFWEGLVNDIRIYDTVLTDDQILEIMGGSAAAHDYRRVMGMV